MDGQVGSLPFWSDDFVTGFSRVDDEHKALLAMFDRVEKLLRDDTVGQGQLEDEIGRLVRFTRKHLAHEEELMDGTDFAKSEEHKEEHKVLFDETERLLIEAKAAKDLRYVMPPLKQLRRSTEQHIVDMDRDLGKHLESIKSDDATKLKRAKTAEAAKRGRQSSK